MTSADDTTPTAPEPGPEAAPQAPAQPPASGDASAAAPDPSAATPPPAEAPATEPAGGSQAPATEPIRIDTPQRPEPERKPMSPGSIMAFGVLLAVLLAAVVGFAAGFLGAYFGIHANPILPDRITVVPPKTAEPVAAAAAAIIGSVVNVDVSGSQPATGLPSGHPSVPTQGNGSGVAFKSVPGGGTYILTNDHVVNGATKITVTDSLGVVYPATLVGADTESDIAVIKVAGKLPLAQLGNSDNLTVGELAVAIGSPYGLQHSVTSGVVSAIHRSLSAAEFGTSGNLLDAIQTDAAINPGNSGGALVDRLGRLIGINTAIFSQSGSSAGIGFAIPINSAIRTADDLITTGKARHPFLGISGRSVDTSLAASQKLPVNYGAYVDSTIPGTGAAKAGLKKGDVIVQVGDRAVRTFDDLRATVKSLPVGSTVTVQFYRDGVKQSVSMTVGDQPKQ